MDLTKLKILEQFQMTGDLKLLNILVGIQNHSSRYPCHLCEGFKDKETGVWFGTDVHRTWASIIQHNTDWLDKSQGRYKHIV